MLAALGESQIQFATLRFVLKSRFIFLSIEKHAYIVDIETYSKKFSLKFRKNFRKKLKEKKIWSTQKIDLLCTTFVVFKQRQIMYSYFEFWIYHFKKISKMYGFSTPNFRSFQHFYIWNISLSCYIWISGLTLTLTQK